MLAVLVTFTGVSAAFYIKLLWKDHVEVTLFLLYLLVIIR